MPSTVIVNNLTAVHKDSGGVSMAFPDVCKTPTPAGPVPMPYPNVAKSSDTASGSRTVTGDGNPLMLKSSHFATSTGDEAGSAMGVASNKIKGKAYPKMYSFDVKVEGQNVFRFTDIMLQNGGSPTNTPPAAEMQNTKVAVGTSAGTLKDPEEPEVVKLAWARQEACCGDEAALNVGTKNCPEGSVLSVRIHRAGEPKSVVGGLSAKLSGNKANPRWVTRRGPYKKEVKVAGLQEAFKGQQNTSKELLLKAPEPIAKEKIGPKQVRTPVYTESTVLGKKRWIKDLKRVYGWEVCYEIELKTGELMVTRLIDFELQAGAKAPKQLKRLWKKEIENVWDRKFRLHRSKCKRGNDCNCSSKNGCCSFNIRIRCGWGRGHGQKVLLYAGANDPKSWGKKGKWWFSHDWWEQLKGVPVTVRAHEFGHLIGMYDEYPAGACDPLRKYDNIPLSIMSSGKTVYQQHMKDFHAWFEKKVKSIIGPTRLRRI
jgi:hypothetical protein